MFHFLTHLFLSDHIWSHVELFNLTIYNSPCVKCMEKLIMVTPAPCKQTDTCENITSPHPSDTDGKNSIGAFYFRAGFVCPCVV